ncbi:hypothetical protein EV182_006570, partial [Spiromyces aspiralis]
MEQLQHNMGSRSVGSDKSSSAGRHRREYHRAAGEGDVGARAFTQPQQHAPTTWGPNSSRRSSSGSNSSNSKRWDSVSGLGISLPPDMSSARNVLDPTEPPPASLIMPVNQSTLFATPKISRRRTFDFQYPLLTRQLSHQSSASRSSGDRKSYTAVDMRP